MERTGINYEQAAKHESKLAKTRVYEYAEEAANILRFLPQANIQHLVKDLGGRIHVADFASWTDDGNTIYVHKPKDFDIIISLMSSPRRDRFTIAHELGHYFLHSKQGQIPLVANRSGSNRAEWEANWFAAGFLMPEKPFRREALKNSSSDSLANAFGVSTAAAEVRLKEIGLA